jgi:predicted kinase
MAKLIAICGKVCSGKSYYAATLKEKENAVILSCDDVTMTLFDNDLGDNHDVMVKKIMTHLKDVSLKIIATGTNVILDWGFWSKKDREELTEYYKNNDVPIEWHYICVDDQTWEKNIEERNKRVEEGNGGSDFHVGEGLKNKVLSRWIEPTKEEIDIWINLER